MSKHNTSPTELASMLTGAVTSAGVGSFLLDSLGALLLGIMGAIGGYLFTKFIKPQFDKLFSKNKIKSNETKS